MYLSGWDAWVENTLIPGGGLCKVGFQSNLRINENAVHIGCMSGLGGRQADRKTDRQTNRETDKDRPSGGQTDRETDWPIGQPTNRKRDSQRKIDR